MVSGSLRHEEEADAEDSHEDHAHVCDDGVRDKRTHAVHQQEPDRDEGLEERAEGTTGFILEKKNINHLRMSDKEL